ncbi:uncharacterized protein LOC118435501 [Folsomia candida]|uniref:Uncharacterized protein n=1 Tax=Folsomia candida TaxID=158441 RepID=A0A226F3Z7_FOLCA|nr:uncharacterized protein LOC118435501 [Folsomia candida]OXA63636.1 hypothetical protein Fcan01_01725 [Folsomia candida]
MSTHMVILPLVILGMTVASSMAGLSAQAYFDRYHKEIFEGAKCNAGWIELSQRVQDAAHRCAKKEVMGSYLCFLTCVSREYEYITPGTTHDLDMGMADLVAMESFNTSTRTGRDSYFKVSLKRYHCAEEFVVGEGKKVVLAMKYDVAEDCETARAFFTCTWPTLTCDKYNIKEETTE